MVDLSIVFCIFTRPPIRASEGQPGAGSPGDPTIPVADHFSSEPIGSDLFSCPGDQKIGVYIIHIYIYIYIDIVYNYKTI